MLLLRQLAISDRNLLFTNPTVSAAALGVVVKHALL